MQLGERTETSATAPLDGYVDGSASVLTLAPRTIPHPYPDAATIAASRARHPSMAPIDPPTPHDEPDDVLAETGAPRRHLHLVWSDGRRHPVPA